MNSSIGIGIKLLRRVSRQCWYAHSCSHQSSTNSNPRKFNVRTDGPTTDSRLQSLQAKSFGRTAQGYVPPADLARRIDDIVEQVKDEHPQWDRISLADRHVCFKVLTRCIDELQHDIPSSCLGSLLSVPEVQEYFSVAVNAHDSLEQLASSELPPNLHVHKEYVRFSPDSDTFFGGKTAFPERETVVTSLKYRRKYSGHEAHKTFVPKRER